MPAAAPRLAPAAASRRLLLADLDNCPARRDAERWWLEQLLAAAGPSDARLAAATPAVPRRYRRHLAELGFTVLPARPGRDGADLALLRAAHRLLDSTASPEAVEVVVASDDAIFRRLARPRVRLVVLTRDPHLVSVPLRAVAAQMVALPADDCLSRSQRRRRARARRRCSARGIDDPRPD